MFTLDQARLKKAAITTLLYMLVQQLMPFFFSWARPPKGLGLIFGGLTFFIIVYFVGPYFERLFNKNR